MDTRTSLILWFTFGVALQGLALLRLRISWSKLGVCLFVAAFALIPGKNENGYDAHFHWLTFLVLFAVTFAASFRDEILPYINERVLLSYTLIFWYFFADNFYHGPQWQMFLLRAAIVPTAVAIYAGFSHVKPSFALRLLLYTWFLVVVVVIGVAQFSPSRIEIFFSDSTTSWLAPLDCVLAGMVSLYLAAHLTYLFLLIPIPGKNQSWENRMKEWWELTEALAHRMAGDHRTGWLGFILLATEAALLFLNYSYQFADETLLINGLIILPFVFSAITGDSIRLEFRRDVTKERW